MNCKAAFSARAPLPVQVHCPLCLFLVVILGAANIHFQETNLWKSYQLVGYRQRGSPPAPVGQDTPGVLGLRP